MEEILGTFGINWKLLLIQAINFGILLLILHRVLYRPLVRMMNERQAVLEKGVKDAEDAETKLSEIEEEKQEIITDANKEAERIVASSHAYGKSLSDEAKRDAEAQKERILKDAEAKAAELSRQAIKESEREISEMIVLGAEKVLREKK